MNKTAIEWCDLTWNPVTGCNHGCPYCYARKIAERFKGSKAWPRGFEPTFHKERLGQAVAAKRPSTVFVCSVADLFGEWVPTYWIQAVMTEAAIGHQHTYIFLTKNPDRYQPLSVDPLVGGWMNRRPNWWFGTTITGKGDMPRLWSLQASDLPNRFISFEPLLENLGDMDLTGIRQVIVGAQTNPSIVPSGDAIRSVVVAAKEAGANVFFKDSMQTVSWPGQSHFVNVHDLSWTLRKEVSA